MEAVTLEKEYCVEMQSISKHFGGVQALKNVDFALDGERCELYSVKMELENQH